MDKKQFAEMLTKFMHGENIKIKTFFHQLITHISHVVILVLGMSVAFGAGYYYKDFKNTVSKTTNNSFIVHKAADISVATNEKSQVIIIDLPAGVTHIFPDTIAQLIVGQVIAKTAVVAKQDDVKPVKKSK